MPKVYFAQKTQDITQRSFDDWMASTGMSFRKVKSRNTLKIHLNRKAYVIKKQWGIGWKEMIKNYLTLKIPIVDVLPEWNALNYLAELGIRAPKPIGFGSNQEKSQKRQSFILMEYLNNKQNLETFSLKELDFFSSVCHRRHWIRTIANIIHDLHHAGIYHKDLYLCHFLFDKTNTLPNEKEVHLIDLHRAQIKLPFPERWRFKDLAALNFSAWPLALSQRDKLFFIRCYTKKPLKFSFRKKYIWWLKIEHRSKKILRRCCVEALQIFYHYWKLDIPWFEAPNKKKHGWSGVVTTHLPAYGTVFIKRQANYFKNCLRHPIRGELSLQKEYRNILRLKNYGMPTLNVCYFDTAYLDKKWCGILITTALNQYLNLNEWIQIYPKEWPQLQATLIKQLATLHQHHWSHGALYPKHILVKKIFSEQTIDLRLIDLENMHHLSSKLWCAFKDLNKLNRYSEGISIKKRLKFLKAYLKEINARYMYTPFKQLLIKKYRK